jgi:HCOMODA/2-hydroxy-3-carboxy-muconic semialdehyde decarboxylase
MEDFDGALHDLVVANRILANEGVVDAFGHISIRQPDKPDRYIMSCSRSPELVVTDDLMEYTLDGDPFDQRDRPMYAERHIHGAVFEARPDVNAVVHNHSYDVIPFTVTGVPLRPMFHMASTLGAHVPVWDIRDKFGDTNLLVTNMETGRDLAGCLGDARVALMRGHGCVVGCGTVKEAVHLSIYLQLNARMQMQAMQMGDPKYLTPGEMALGEATYFGELSVGRSWEYWRARAGGDAI